MSQRDPGGPVQSCIARAEANLRMLLDVPDNYKILFFQVRDDRSISCLVLCPSFVLQLKTIAYLQGGAHAQFAAIPMNLLGE